LFIGGFQFLKTTKPDIIHSHSADLGFFISIPAKIYGIPVINTCHGISFNDKQFSFLKRSAEKYLLKFAGFKKIIAIDPPAIEALRREKIGPAVFIPNGIDLGKFQKKTVRENSLITLLFVGRLEKQKGVIYLLEALRELKTNIGFRVIIVGDGSEKRSLERLSHEYNLDGMVTFRGKVDEATLTRLYQESDIFVLPSLWEGMPLTLLEAAAAGMAIIATDVGGISSFFVNEEHALLIEPRNITLLAGAIEKLLNDNNLRRKLGSNANNVAGKYSWRNTSEELSKIYNNIMCE
jgi:glycosyltransferase involved in cell wall biosynthesis